MTNVAMDTAPVLTDQPPPDILMTSEDATKRPPDPQAGAPPQASEGATQDPPPAPTTENTSPKLKTEVARSEPEGKPTGKEEVVSPVTITSDVGAVGAEMQGSAGLLGTSSTGQSASAGVGEGGAAGLETPVPFTTDEGPPPAAAAVGGVADSAEPAPVEVGRQEVQDSGTGVAGEAEAGGTTAPASVSEGSVEEASTRDAQVRTSVSFHCPWSLPALVC